jgi:hypothetical protein
MDEETIRKCLALLSGREGKLILECLDEIVKLRAEVAEKDKEIERLKKSYNDFINNDW